MRIKNICKILMIAIAFLSARGGFVFGENSLEASLELERVFKGNPVYLYLTFTGSTDLRPPEVGPIDGLNIRQVGSSTQMTAVGRNVSRSITYSYLVMPLKGGTYNIGPFNVTVAGRRYSAPAVTLEVDEAPPQATAPDPSGHRRAAHQAVSRPDEPTRPPGTYEGHDVFLRLEVPETAVYVNQVVPVKVTLYVDNVGLRDIEYPVFSHEGFSSGRMEQPERKRASYRGKIYETLVFSQGLSAFREGEYTIGPAVMNCERITRAQRTSRRSSIFGVGIFMDDPFSTGLEAHPIRLESNEVSVRVLPLPEEGKPENFAGAVGMFSFDAILSPSEIYIGDPVTLTMTIRGEGNLDAVTAPVLDAGEDLRVYEPSVKIEGNKKVYEQIIIPRSEEIKEIPAVSFSFFDPYTGSYQTRTKGPFPLAIKELPESRQPFQLVSMPFGEHIFRPAEELGRDILHIKYSPGRISPKGFLLIREPFFWPIQALMPALFMAFMIYHKKISRIKKDPGYARSLKALDKARAGLKKARRYAQKNDHKAFYDSLQSTMKDYLSGKFNLSPGDSDIPAISEKLGYCGAGEDLSAEISKIFSVCEMARYSSFLPEEHDHETIISDAKKILSSVEKLDTEIFFRRPKNGGKV